MKVTGITRPIDNVGRVCLPMELRREMGLKVEDRMKISTDGGKIIMEKSEQGCTFCKSRLNLKEFGGHQVCGHCRDDIRKLLSEGKVR